MGTDRALWPDRLWLAIAHTKRSRLEVEGLPSVDLSTTAARAHAYHVLSERLKATERAEKDRLLAIVESSLGPVRDPGPFRLMTWDEAAEMSRSGLVTFAAHTVHHEILSRCEDDVVRREVHESQREVQRRTGRAPRVFAYPNGSAADFDERSREAVRSAGLSWALCTEQGLVQAGDDPLALPRICVGAAISFSRFRLLCSGLIRQPRAAPR
jgi:peptidoglycan/xylan/chitin deacetylase (PgdA/CDA1 family)